jgi:hypothetical protein
MAVSKKIVTNRGQGRLCQWNAWLLKAKTTLGANHASGSRSTETGGSPVPHLTSATDWKLNQEILSFQLPETSEELLQICSLWDNLTPPQGQPG